MARHTLFVIRYPKLVRIEGILCRIHKISEYGKMPIGPLNLDPMQINVWTSEPATLKGLIADHNEDWPGLTIGIVSEEKKI